MPSGIDGISLLMVLLTTFITPLSIAGIVHLHPAS